MYKNIRGEKPKEEEKIRGEWFNVNYDPEQVEIKIEIKEQKVINHFTAVREKYDSCMNDSRLSNIRKEVIGQYGNAVSSAKRNIMREYVLIMTKIFIDYYMIDVTYATAREVIMMLFNVSVKREILLKNFSTPGREANKKSNWFRLGKEEKIIVVEQFLGLIDLSAQYKPVKEKIDQLVSKTKT